jgi:DNA-directed RNA polymerase subunit RPC12/RpoP
LTAKGWATVKITREQPFGFEFECRGCKSQLVAEIGDVKVGYFGANYGGDSPEREYYVDCPVCGTHRILKYNEVTPKVREQADKTDRRRR